MSTIHGMAAAPGLTEGPARVLRSAADIGQVRDGEVLVVPLTSPEWLPAFGRIVAVVTDTGGVTSHAAIVCREYGLPAVTGASVATAQIATGCVVRVDGDRGEVTVLRDAARRCGDAAGPDGTTSCVEKPVRKSIEEA